MRAQTFRLVVLDLDFTLWDAGGLWCDHLSPPFRMTDAMVKDSEGRSIKLYPDVKVILQLLKLNGVEMAIASKTMEASWALELLRFYDLTEYFSIAEMYPRCKQEHFEKIHRFTGIDYKETIFFDDEIGNIHDVSKLGVTCVHVKNGLDLNLLSSHLLLPKKK